MMAIPIENQFGFFWHDASVVDTLRDRITALLPDLIFTISSGTHVPATRDTFGPEITDREEGITIKFLNSLTNSSEVNRFEVETVFSCFNSNTPITSLLANGSYIDNAGATVIAEFLKTTTSLRVLDLHYSHITKEGVLAIIDALRTNNSLEYLNIRANGINNEVLNVLYTVLQHENKSLRRIELTRHNFIHEKALDQGLLHNIYNQLHLNRNPASVVVQDEHFSNDGARTLRT